MKREHFEQMLAKASKSVQALNRDLARVCPIPDDPKSSEVLDLSRPSTQVKRIRQSHKPLMNKLEAEWFNWLNLNYPPSAKIRPQSLRFRLANGLWFKPDFTSTKMLTAWECKGPHAFRGGFENLKMAAATYPEWGWYLVWKENGDWQEQEVLP